jgi:hypothetical protein
MVVSIEMKLASSISLALLGAVPLSAHADASCADVFDAGVHEVETPHHIYYSNASGKNGGRTFESIFDGNAIYSNATGAWKKSEAAHQAMLENAQQQRKALDATCTRVGSESIDGASATHWHIKPNAESDAVASDLWIDAKGRPVHQRMVQPDGGTRDVRIDYENVKTPAG